jgi:glycosyltransferase involved in cell wall biosynthesis
VSLLVAQEERKGPTLRAGALTRRYSVVHLVAQEMHKGLIESQVLDHMAHHASVHGADAPRKVAVAFLEPVRVALRAAARRRVRALRRRAPNVTVMLLPYVSRLGIDANARLLAIRLRRFCAGDPFVLHCRSETAVTWAAAFRHAMPSAAIVADFRGVWPDEYLYAKGVDGVAAADPATREGYERALAEVKRALQSADMVLTVSSALGDWLAGHGSRREAAVVVPTCVSGITFSASDRRLIRDRLGVADKVVLVYSGTVTRYQHVDEGFAAFARIAIAQLGEEHAHVLAITPDVAQMRAALTAANVPITATTVTRLPQQEVASYLSAGDVGFLLRADNIVNRVSVPVKLGEYLAAGIPVVVSRVDGWLQDLVTRAAAGWSVDWFGSSEGDRQEIVARIIHELRHGPSRRAGALALCREHFLWSAHTQRVREVYLTALARVAVGVSNAVAG